MKLNTNKEPTLNWGMIKGKSSNIILEDNKSPYIDLNEAKNFLENYKNTIDRKNLYEQYNEDIVSFFSDLNKIPKSTKDIVNIDNIIFEKGEIKVFINTEELDDDLIFILSILGFIYKINRKNISFHYTNKGKNTEIEYNILSSKEYIYDHILRTLGIYDGIEVNERIDNILASLGESIGIFNKIKDLSARYIYFGDLHENEYFGLEFGGFDKAVFLAQHTKMKVESNYLDNLNGLDNSFPNVINTKKGIKLALNSVFTNTSNKIKSIEELLDKKIEKILNKETNSKKAFFNLLISILDNLDHQDHFYSNLIGAEPTANNALRIYLKPIIKERLSFLFKGISKKVFSEIKKYKGDKLLLKRKILSIFHNFLNTQIYNLILDENSKKYFINTGVLTSNGEFKKDLESEIFLSDKKKSKYKEVKNIINLFLEDDLFGINFIEVLFKKIFESVTQKKVYLMTMNINGDYIEFNLIENNNKIYINFGENTIKIKDFINNYLNQNFPIIEITGKLWNINSILKGDLVLASERGGRKVTFEAFQEFLPEDIFQKNKKLLEKLIYNLQLVDNFEEKKEIYEYEKYPIAFSTIIPKKNILLAYCLGDEFIKTQLGNKEHHKLSNLEQKYYREINKEVDNYLTKIGLTKHQAIKRVFDIKYFITENKTRSHSIDVTILDKCLNTNPWIALEGFLLIKKTQYLEKEFISSEEIDNLFDATIYINRDRRTFEVYIEKIATIYNNTFPEVQEVMENNFFENFNNFLDNIDYDFKIINNSFDNFLSKINFFISIFEKIFRHCENTEIKEKIISVYKNIEKYILANLYIENYPDSLILITKLDNLGIIKFNKKIDIKGENIKESFTKIYSKHDGLKNILQNRIIMLFEMKIDFIKNNGIEFLTEDNDLTLHNIFEKILNNKIKEDFGNLGEINNFLGRYNESTQLY